MTSGAYLVALATRHRVVDAACALAGGDIHDEAAFEAVVAAVSLYLDTVRRAGPAPVLVVPFGLQRGQPITHLATGELQHLERYLGQAVEDAQKRRSRSSNLHLRAAVLEELGRRGGTSRGVTP